MKELIIRAYSPFSFSGANRNFLKEKIFIISLQSVSLPKNSIFPLFSDMCPSPSKNRTTKDFLYSSGMVEIKEQPNKDFRGIILK